MVSCIEKCLLHQKEHFYDYIVKREKDKHPVLSEKKEGIQYTVISNMLQALNITYPHEDFDKNPNPKSNIENFL